MTAGEWQPATRPLRSVALHAVMGALLFASVAIFTPAAFINSGLRNGWRGLFGAIIGAAAIIALLSWSAAATGATRFFEAGRLLFEIGLAATTASLLIRRQFSSGAVILGGVAASAIGFLLTELVFRSVFEVSLYTTIVTELKAEAAEAIRIMSSSKSSTSIERVKAMKQVFELISGPFLPAFLASIWVMSFVITMVVVPRLPSGLATGERYLFRSLAFPDWLLVVFIGAGLSPLFPEPYRTAGLNLLVVVLGLYLVQGLAIYRAALARLPIGVFGLIAAFALLLVLSEIALIPGVLLLLAGLFDPFFDFRKLNRKEQTNESDSD